MTVAEMANKLDLKVLGMPMPELEVKGVYTGDLLSWVMGRATASQAWVTIMTNINVLAVATLKELPAVIMCDGSFPDADVIERAADEEINLFTSEKSSYEICTELYELLK